MLPSCASICHGGSETLQGSLRRGSPPDKLRGQKAEALLRLSHKYRATSTGRHCADENDAFQGKRKVKDWWSENEYVVVHQVADGVPAYEVKDEAGSMKTIHHN